MIAPEAKPESNIPQDQFVANLQMETDLERIQILEANGTEAVIKHDNNVRRLATNQVPRAVLQKIVKFSEMTAAEAERKAAAASEKRRADGIKQYNLAVQLGYIRQVNGIVYDLRKPSPDWILFQSARVREDGESMYLMEDIGRRSLGVYSPILFFLKKVGSGKVLVTGDITTIRAMKVGAAPAPTARKGYTQVARSNVRQFDNSGKTNVTATESVSYAGVIEDEKMLPVYDAGLVVSPLEQPSQ